MKKDNRSIIGYVINEYEHFFKVLIRNDLCIKIEKPKIISLMGSDQKIKSVFYEYEEISGDAIGRYVVTDFWSIRFKIITNAMNNMVYLINKVILKEDMKIHQTLSS